jgi:hypothetical protein
MSRPSIRARPTIHATIPIETANISEQTSLSRQKKRVNGQVFDHLFEIANAVPTGDSNRTAFPHTLKAQVLLADFREVILSLEVTAVIIIIKNCRGLSQLCDQFGCTAFTISGLRACLQTG